jgi:hypothetical protein
MALPPTIPTSFVPRPTAARRHSVDLVGVFGFFMYAILGIVFLMALGVFSYGQILSAEQSRKDGELVAAEANIDQTTIEDFVRLSNRLKQGRTLLSKHVALSNFFNLIQTILPTNVRFSTLHVSFDSRGAPKVDGAGIAKNFNALAAASTAFAADNRVKDAIFSKLSVNKDSTVSFELSATLDPKLIVFTPSENDVTTTTIPAP